MFLNRLAAVLRIQRATITLTTVYPGAKGWRQAEPVGRSGHASVLVHPIQTPRLARWWPLPAAAVVLIIQQYGWTRAARGAVAAGRAAWPALRWAWPLLVAGLLIAWFHRPETLAEITIRRPRPRRSPQLPLLGGLAIGALGVLLLVFVVLPPWLVPDGAIADPAQLYGARNAVVRTALQAAAGIVLLMGIYFSWGQLHTAREGQVTERFTRAIDQLGSDRLDLRLGGIYALERIAQNSKADRPTVAEVLCAYVREHSPWPPTQTGQGYADLTPRQVRDLPALHLRMPDVQAALSVLGRGRFDSLTPEYSLPLMDLRATDLRKAFLFGAGLKQARLEGAHLEGAWLVGADLKGAFLDGTHLREARLDGARLEDAWPLSRAHLEGAKKRWDSPVLWPDGFDWRAAGVVEVDWGAKPIDPVYADLEAADEATPTTPQPQGQAATGGNLGAGSQAHPDAS